MTQPRRGSFLRRESFSKLSLSRSSLLLDWPWINTGFDNDLEGTLTALPSLPKSRPTSTLLTATEKQLLTESTPVTSPNLEPSKSEAPSPGNGGPPPSAGPPGPPGPPGGWLADKMTPSQAIAFNVMVCMVQLIPQACLTTCFPIIRILTESLKITDPAVLPWVVAAYAISFGTTILLSGRIGDIFGHRNMVILGFIWLAIFSVVAAVSHYATYEVFFVARAMQGVGSAMMNPNALALLGRSYPPGSKGKIVAFSAFGLCAPLGAYSGMLGSAVLGQLAHWTWCFYALAIASVLLAVAATFILPNPPKTPKQMLPFGQKLAQMDWLGGITGVCGLVAIQVALISAPVQSWKTQYIFMLLIIGLLLIVFFVIIELKVSKEPLVPFKLLNGNVAFVLAAIACGWGTFGVWTYYLWRYLLVILKDTPLKAALHVFPIVPVAIIAAALTAVLMRRTKPAWILFWALIAFTLGPMFLSLNHRGVIYWSFTFLSLLVTPFGMDMSFPSATFIMSNSLPMDKQGVAGSLVTTVVNYSISLGLGLASTVEVHVNHHGRDILQGIKGGWFMGIGLGCLGIFVCTAFVIKTILEGRRDTESPKVSKPVLITQEKDSTEEKSEEDKAPVMSPPTAVVKETAIPTIRPQRPYTGRRGSTRSTGRDSWSGRSTLVLENVHESEQEPGASNDTSEVNIRKVPIREPKARTASYRASRIINRQGQRVDSTTGNRISVRSESKRRKDLEPALRIQETWNESSESVAGRETTHGDSKHSSMI